MPRRITGILSSLFVLCAAGARAQVGGSQLPFPQPYGDRGSSTLGSPPIQYPDPRAPRPDPVSYWKSRIISTGGGCGGSVIIINNGAPCYIPNYYAYGMRGPWYDSAQFSMSMQLGGMQFGFQQRSGYFQNPPITYNNGWAQQGTSLLYRPDRRYDPLAERQRQSSDDDGYYLHQKPKPPSVLDKNPDLAAAIRDIETAFRTGDSRQLERHVVTTETIILQAKGRTRKPLPAADYLEMTREAMKVLKTVRYDLDKVEPASNGAWMAYGTHVLRGEDGTEKSFNVGFVLKKRGDQYVVTEVSADPGR